MTPTETHPAVTPPSAKESEKYVLGVAMNSPEAIGDIVSAGVLPGSFYVPFHRDVWQAILTVDGNGDNPDAITVADELERAGTGVPDTASRLFEMIQTGAVAASATYHAERVLDTARRRDVMLTGARLQQYATEASVPIEDTVDRGVSALEGVETAGDRSPTAVGDLVAETRDWYADSSDHIIWTGFSNLDSMTGGLRGGQMIILAARPGIGKSTLAMDIARQTARTQPVMFFSMEMSRREVTARAMCAELSINHGRFTHNTLNHDEMGRLSIQLEKVSRLGLLVDDSPGLTITELQAKARRQARRQEGLGLIVVDYIGLLRATTKYESRQVEISDYSRALKRLAGELDVPIIVVAQLSRLATDRGGPQLHHLRESGALEQDADKVLLIHREDNRDGGDVEAVVTVAKNRAGEIGQITLLPDLSRCRFRPDPNDLSHIGR